MRFNENGKLNSKGLSIRGQFFLTEDLKVMSPKRTPQSNVTRIRNVLQKRGKNKRKLYTKECGLNKGTKKENA